MRKMSYKYLISKIAADKDGYKLGKIIRIDKLPGKTIKKDIPYLMILVEKRFKKKIVVPIEAEKTIESKGSYVVLNITKEEFDEEAERIRKQKINRETFRGHTQYPIKGGPGNLFIDVSNLSPKTKEKK